MIDATKNLSDRQRQYIWLMGSYPDKIAEQGRGYRTRELKYGLDGDTLVIFGYSTPFLWLQKRGTVRKLQNANAYVLTEVGKTVFRKMQLRGDGFDMRKMTQKVQVAARKEGT